MKRKVRLPGVRFRVASSLVTALLGGGVALSAFAADQLDQQIELDIPEGTSLEDALLQWGAKTGVQLMMPGDVVSHERAPSLHGISRASAALEKLLKGTGLSYTVDRSTVHVIVTIPPIRSAQRVRISDLSNAHLGSELSSSTDAGSAGEEGVTPAHEGQNAHGTHFEEVVVTAQKKSENLLEVPVPVTAINTDTLLESNQVRIQDYYNQIPGLILAPGPGGGYNNIASSVALRGLTTNGGNPTVGITVDGVPYGGTTMYGGGAVPDIDPSELARIEVLRGPQGTLYGASSIGGLINFVTADPSTSGVSGHIESTVSDVRNGTQAGYSVRGAINLPLGDTLAMRASAFGRQDPGYVNNVPSPLFLASIAPGPRGVNWGNVAGGRVAVLWQPQDALTLKFSALVQDSTVHGTSFSYIGLGDLQQSILPGTGVYDTQTQAYSLNISAKLGIADLVSLTGYNIDKYHQVFDYTPTLGSLTAAIFNGVSGSPYTQDHKTDKISEELRLSLPIGDRIDWVLGVFFTNERGHEHDILQAADVTTGAPTDTFFDLNYPVSYKEYAVFTDLTLHFTSRFNVQIGGRESQNKQTFEALVVGPWDPLVLGQSSPFANPRVDTKDNSFTYLVTPTFNLSRDLMLYARLASGYRPGGPNYLSALGTAPSFKPDTTRNYEIGFKGAMWEHRLTVDASVYYIDWRNLQLDEFNQAVQTDYLANGSRAKSDGVELSVEARPLSGLKLSGWVAVNEAKLKEPLPPSSLLVGAAGDRLPFSSRFSGNIAAEEQVPLWGPVLGFAGAQLSYVGGRVGQFVDSGPRQAFPAYAQTNLRAGLRSDDWTVSAFANNVTDRRGIVAGGIGSNIPYAFQFIAPRTIGVSVSRSF